MALFDSLDVRREAVHYSVELASRMDCTVIFLILIALDSSDMEDAKTLEERAKDALRGPMETAGESGLDVDAEVIMGDPSSELIKYMAESRSIKAIVWGGHQEEESGRSGNKHWFSKVKDRLECPVMVPHLKSDGPCR